MQEITYKEVCDILKQLNIKPSDFLKHVIKATAETELQKLKNLKKWLQEEVLQEGKVDAS